MKTKCTPALILAVCASAWSFSAAAQVGIGTTTPHSSAKLEVAATDKGFLPPRVALTGTDDGSTVSSPATGLLVYNTATAGATGKEVTPGLYTWNGSVWERLSANNPNGQDIGYIVGWGSTATPPDYLLPLNGGTFNWADYPDFQTLHADFPSAFVTSSTATTFTLANLNTSGRFLRGGTTPGVNQDDATSLPSTAFTISSEGAHTHDVNPAPVSSSTTGAHTHWTDPADASTTTVGSHTHWTDPVEVFTSTNGSHQHGMNFQNDDYNGQGGGNTSLEDDSPNWGNFRWTEFAGNHNHTVNIPNTESSANGSHSHTINIPSTESTSNGNHAHSVDVDNTTSTSNGAHTHTITGGDTETRPINTSVVWCLKVKSTSTSGAISVNSGATSATNGLTLSNNAVELGGTLTKTTTIQSGGNALILGGSALLGVGKTPSQAVDVQGNIAASGNVSAGGNIAASGTITATGTIRSTAAGSILNTVVLNESDLSFSSNLSISSTETNVFSYNYTPVSSNSIILVEFDGNYNVGGTTGSGTDEFTSRLKIAGTTVQSKTQTWGSGGAGDSRSPALLPIMGKANNSGTSALTISVTLVRTVGDDTVVVYPDLLLKITEIAR